MAEVIHRYGVDALRLHMSGLKPPGPVVLLGAGASVKSGIPAAGDMVQLAGKWAWCQGNGRSFNDQSVTPSDWRPWLHEQPWFDDAIPLAELYPTAVERLLRPRESRREFFLSVLQPDAEIGSGYHALARLMAARNILTVLTVNFDGLVVTAARAQNAISFIGEISGVRDIHQFTLAPSHPQIVALHGTVERYQDRNLETEVQHLDPGLAQALLPLFRDHPLVVIGYRGSEPSVMNDLLIAAAEQPLAYRHGVYWCVRHTQDEDLHPNVLKLARRIGTNFSLVDIEGFDPAMVHWAADVRPNHTLPIARQGDPDVSDLRPTDLSLEELDVRLLTARVADYDRRLDFDAPDPEESADSAWAALAALRLARDTDDGAAITRAGELLFARSDVVHVEVRTHDDAFLSIAGNLFGVLQRVVWCVRLSWTVF